MATTETVINLNQTGSDALARLNQARFGSLVKPDGRPLDSENLAYLRVLRAELHRFSDAVLIELNRIERVAEGARRTGYERPSTSFPGAAAGLE